MSHPYLAQKFVANDERMHWHDETLWFVRKKRDIAIKKIPEWEELRNLASQIKTHTMSNLDKYLIQFEKNAQARGIEVHWAKDAQEHNKIVTKLLKEAKVKKLVKSKSMLSEECELNHHLENEGFEVVDTDLGERIVQFRHEKPSHIVLPAIHLKRQDVAKTFAKFIFTDENNFDPTYLANAMRKHLREKFLGADATVTGVNFAIADTGGIVICTNEGNADLGASLPKLHIACMGIEKIVPRMQDLSVFTRMLARNAVGQAVTTYTSHYHGPVEGGKMHIVIVDNKRSKFLASKDYYQSLNCIRCAACMNTCPVFRRSGGHSYEYVIPGPIGVALASVRDLKKYSSLPFACTLCASCASVCPVKIDLDKQIYKHRSDVVERGLMKKKKLVILNMAAFVLKSTFLTDFGGKIARKIVPILPRALVYSKLNAWGKTRELPKFPKHSFKEIYEKRMK